ncbi:MAG: TetR family transcriptional regulator [Clostridia bacterium]|nr:TetR family transcriptional regulator [Clostridia bacterium]
MAEVEDKRIRRTKRLLRQALAELMQEKEFKDITVTDLVERADINRGTFYVHYRDVYDLREKIENEMIEDFRAMVEDSLPSFDRPALRPMLKRAVDFVDENSTLVRSLLRASGAVSFEAKMMVIVEESRMMILQGKAKQYDRYVARFIAGGAVCMIEKWLADPNPLPKAVLVDMMDELLGKTVERMEL